MCIGVSLAIQLICVYISVTCHLRVLVQLLCCVFFIVTLINLLSPSSDLFLVSIGVLRLGAQI